ncbi:MAG: hypothetical protein EB127_18465 [Alphaproteobacteria bacterium]|nr:hypothetical protein [Alphaproteobacteria bacterium]
MNPMIELVEKIQNQKMRVHVMSMHGMEHMSIMEKVQFVQRTWHISKVKMLWQARFTLGFPLTTNQVDKYFDHKNLCLLKGNMRRRTDTKKDLKSRKEEIEIRDYLNSVC